MDTNKVIAVQVHEHKLLSSLFSKKKPSSHDSFVASCPPSSISSKKPHKVPLTLLGSSNNLLGQEKFSYLHVRPSNKIYQTVVILRGQNGTIHYHLGQVCNSTRNQHTNCCSRNQLGYDSTGPITTSLVPTYIYACRVS